VLKEMGAAYDGSDGSFFRAIHESKGWGKEKSSQFLCLVWRLLFYLEIFGLYNLSLTLMAQIVQGHSGASNVWVSCTGPLALIYTDWMILVVINQRQTYSRFNMSNWINEYACKFKDSFYNDNPYSIYYTKCMRNR
jgi:hypothetical protein